MKRYLDIIEFKTRIIMNSIDLTDYLEKIYSAKEDKGTLNINENNNELTYEKYEDKIKIAFMGIERYLDKEPISFKDENGKLLFKIYDKPNPNIMNNIISTIPIDYNFYNSNHQIIKKEELLNSNEKNVILKLKNEDFEKLFKPLFQRTNSANEKENIKTNLLLPFESTSLGLLLNSDFCLIIKQRIPLINKIYEYFQNDKILVIKIFGIDGIGKSISYLFFTTLNDKYKKIYFNLKDMFKYPCDRQEYFIKTLMKYYLNFNSENNIDDNTIKLNYSFYMKHKEIIKKKILSNDFWEMLTEFCEQIEEFSNSIIIIDQYKQEYDEKQELNNIIKKCMKKKSIRFIISSSLNDNTVKEDFILNLKYILKINAKNKENIKENIEENTNENFEKNMDIENKLFHDFSFENEIEDIKNPNNRFDKIIILNDDTKNIKPLKSSKIIEKNDDSVEAIPLYDISKIIYINDLISMENIINKNHNEYFKIFNYNPKTYNEFNLVLSKNKFDLNEESYIILLDKIYEDIENKVNDFYYNLKKKNLLNESEENLKGTYLIKLMDIIKNKEIIDCRTLIKYLKIFPFKYIKIYLNDETSENINFININAELINKRFILDYSYEFVKLAFLKIIYKIPSSTIIDIKELSDSAIGSFIENKIKRYIEKIDNVKIRYFWNFTNLSKTGHKELPEEKFDFKSFKRLEYDDIKKYKINDFGKIYYIIPGSQTNKSLDAIILIPCGDNEFNMICLQITKHKKTIKKKSEYIDDSFIAKSKFQGNYGIKIKNVYFYFILSKDFINEDTKNELEINNISYFYFSIKNETFEKNNSKIDITNLCNPYAQIFQEIIDNEYRTFENKNELIKMVENFLIKKRKRDKNFQISEKNYEKARKHIFKLTGHISLDNNIEKEMNEIVENMKKIQGNFIFTYVYNVNFDEVIYLKKNENLIGVIIDEDKNNKKNFHYYYLGKFYPADKRLDPDIYLKMLTEPDHIKRLVERKSNYLLSEIPFNLCDSIFVFKIYAINN